ncbi:MAG: hypothetical protein HKP42_08280 [Maribacter sp.]|nr:hypothetical protein [Bacteroidia bacterium]NNK76046.1 hypothetical protein [Maribacter sp.]
MAESQDKQKGVPRRKILPLLGSSLLIPFLGHSRQKEHKTEEREDLYETLLKPDGTTVRVKKSSLNKAKVVDKKMSNTSLLHWLGMKK